MQAAAILVFIVALPTSQVSHYNVDGLVQERHNSSALAMELLLSYTNPSMYVWHDRLWFQLAFQFFYIWIMLEYYS